MRGAIGIAAGALLLAASWRLGAGPGGAPGAP